MNFQKAQKIKKVIKQINKLSNRNNSKAPGTMRKLCFPQNLHTRKLGEMNMTSVGPPFFIDLSLIIKELSKDNKKLM